MKDAILLLVAALGTAAVVSLLLWGLPKLFRRREPTFSERLNALAPTPGTRVGPSSGISGLTPISDDASTPSAHQPDPEAVRSGLVPPPASGDREPQRAAPKE